MYSDAIVLTIITTTLLITIALMFIGYCHYCPNQDYYCGAMQGCISCVTCSYPELTEDHVLTSAYVKIFRTVTRNAVNKSV